ncbi:hypothetical protein DA717_14480 [Piscirickettsiaceae bacterium NZ-RLO2]|uniref:nucleotidyltransferase domain-containing protein n=1 Tax=Piscirickettsia salmonis TaxID=1238 RepID=UPI000F087FCF|nr:hypothetical protein DA717_14480 [Piscirickettsiaceae bacterium NZ-RLO2]
MKYGLSTESIEEICNVLSKYPEVQEAIIYGSRARGDYRQGSDIDLTLKGMSLNLSTLTRIENEIDDLLLPYEMDLSSFEALSDANLISNIEKQGKVLYSR